MKIKIAAVSDDEVGLEAAQGIIVNRKEKLR